MLAELVQGGGTDHAQLAAGEHRLDHVAGIHRGVAAAPAPTIVCSSSTNVTICPSESVISCRTALSRSSNSPRYFAPATIEARSSAIEALALQALRERRRDDPLGEALDDRGLADAGLADEHRVVLRAAGEHLDDAALSAEETDACFIVRDANGQALAYVYFEDEPGIVQI